jgi:hypothetical protein
MAQAKSTKNAAKGTLRPQIRIMFRKAIAMGPGKADLLQAIGETGSISAAARRMKMSYRRAWLLVDTMNQSFDEPLVETATGGNHGAGPASPGGPGSTAALPRNGCKGFGSRFEGNRRVHPPDDQAARVLIGPSTQRC